MVCILKKGENCCILPHTCSVGGGGGGWAWKDKCAALPARTSIADDWTGAKHENKKPVVCGCDLFTMLELTRRGGRQGLHSTGITKQTIQTGHEVTERGSFPRGIENQFLLLDLS
jgi:hypothetical protein